MEINTNNPVSNEVRGLDNTQKISPVKRRKRRGDRIRRQARPRKTRITG